MKAIVIYHRADFDGIFCREIAKKFLPPDTEFIGWDYGDPMPAVPTQRADGNVDNYQLYILDLSVDGLMDYPGLIWIDHHKSAIDKYDATTGSSEGDVATRIAGYRIDGVAACRLAWQWFANVERQMKNDFTPDKTGRKWVQAHYPFPTKQDFIDRRLQEPWAVRLAGEYDIWDKRDSDAELFQHGLRSEILHESTWDRLLNYTGSPAITHHLLNQGRAIQYAKTQENDSIIKANGFTIKFEGKCLLACNAARYNSQLFAAGLKPEHDGMLGFNWDGKQWRVSLYSDKPGMDLTPIAIKYGGGGHAGACGFRTKTLPFLT